MGVLSEILHFIKGVMLLNIFEGAADEEMAQAASHIGVCSGMVTQLRGMAQLASQV